MVLNSGSGWSLLCVFSLAKSICFPFVSKRYQSRFLANSILVRSTHAKGKFGEAKWSWLGKHRFAAALIPARFLGGTCLESNGVVP